MEVAGDGIANHIGGALESPKKTLGEIIRDQHEEAAIPTAEERPAKVSLMELMADEDRCSNGFEEPDEEEGRIESEAEKGQIASICCVCMVRNKGAAFIPCGHTFCRLCSRELWVSRGNCPLCNRFIHEILDIF